MSDVYLRGDGDVALDGWTNQADGTSNIFQSIDETSAGDSDFVQSPAVEGGAGGGTITMGDQYDTTYPYGRATTFQKVAQHFISVGPSISQITIWTYKEGGPTDGVQIKIFTTDGSHNPTTTQVGVTSNVVAAADIAISNAASETFTFATPVPVTVGVEYCFVVERTGTLNDSASYYIARQESPDAYVPGYFHTWNGTAWADTTDRDIVCIIEQPAPSGGTITINPAASGAFYFGLDGYERTMQSFISVGNTVTSVKVWIGTQNFPTDNVVAKLYTANASHYPATLIATADNVVSGSSMPHNPDYLECTFTFTGVSVSSGTEYCIAFERSTAPTYSHYYIIRQNTVEPYYTGGICASFNGTSWSVPGSIVNYDLSCIIEQPVTLAIGSMAATDPVLWGNTGSFNKIAQNFISVGTAITKIRIKLKTSGSPSDSVQLKIFTADGSHRPGTQIGVTSNAQAASGMTSSFAIFEFTFATPVPVTNGGEYNFVVERTGSLSDSNNYNNAIALDTYAPGMMHSLAGSTWSDTSIADVVAEIDFSVAAATANLKVRLFDGSTQIVEWTHSDIADTFADAVQTLTAPQIAAITNFNNLFAELDDTLGSVYRFSLSNPGGGVVAPVAVKYRFKKLATSGVASGTGTAAGVGAATAQGATGTSLQFVAASSQYLTHAAGIDTTFPVTFACWFKRASITASEFKALISLGVTSGIGRIILGIQLDGELNCQVIDETNTAGLAATVAKISANTWHHACGVFNSVSDRTIYLDGTNAVQNTATISDTFTPTQAYIGTRWDSSLGRFHDGVIAEAAIWNAALTAGNAASLAAGAAPNTVGSNLVAYWKLNGDGVTEADSAGSFTMDGTGHAPTRVAGRPT